MKRAKESLAFYIITLLLSSALLLPLISESCQASAPTSATIILDDHTFAISILKSIPLLLLLVILHLRDRVKLELFSRTDFLHILFLVTAGAAAALIFPGTEGSYTVNITGLRSYALAFVFALVSASTEELFFRSWLISGLRKAGYPLWLVFGFPLSFFALLHLWQGWSGFLFALTTGALYSVFYMRRPRISVLIIAHTIHNTLALILMSTVK